MPVSQIDVIRQHFKIAPHTDKGDRFQAYCPAHDDKNASLSIKLTPEKALLFCHAGCTIEQILKAVGLTYKDLFTNSHVPTNIYQYRNLDGSLSHEKLKYKTPTGKTFTQRHITDSGEILENMDGVKRIPYNFPEVLKAISQGAPILYCEGEKDADTARLLGYVATTMGGASDWKDEYKDFFKDAILIQFPDKDDAGLKLAHKVTESLKKVARSLKVAIVPVGKDLTEWVEAGNKDIASLIESARELITAKWLSNVIFGRTPNDGYSFKLKQFNLEVLVERLSDDYEGIIKVVDNGDLVHTSKINLMAMRSKKELAGHLEKIKKVDWDAILNLVTNKCGDTLSDGGQTEDVSTVPASMTIDYILEPILVRNEPTTLYTSGGKGKSIFADFFAVIMQYGYAPPEWNISPEQANVLYLDWESNPETHRRYITAIKKGLGITDKYPIHYRQMQHPLAQVIESVRAEVSRLKIDVVIIDSQMAATANGSRALTEAQIASEYYNNLNSLHCTSLTIDHITKAGMSAPNGADAPYGTVTKFNRSRSQFELQLAEEYDESDHKVYALVHRKFNLGAKQPPIGVKVDFINNGNELVSISFADADVTTSKSLSRNLTQWKQVDAILRHEQPLTAAAIAEKLDNPVMNAKRVSDILHRYTDKFILRDSTTKTWGRAF